MAKSIIILGDSTSMSIGIERAMYPFKLAEKRIWAKGSKIINCSLPGFTSSDACRFFFENKHSFGEIITVILYLGNCDTMLSEIPSSRVTALRSLHQRLKRYLKRPAKRTKLKNRFLYCQWNSDIDQGLEQPVPISFFEYNLKRIIKYCQRRKIRVILVRPEAHLMFPAGSGKGNYIFYNYLGLNPPLSKRMVFDDQRFILAAKAYENQEFEKAANIYKNILLNPSTNYKNLEYQTLIVNNFAACQANLLEFKEAEYLLNLLLKERESRREIFQYNLSMISLMRNKRNEYSSRIKETFELDTSMYRVREPYKMVIDRLTQQFSNVSMVDMREFIVDTDFVDHCHPLPDAQTKIADAILNNIDIDNLKGSSKLKIENQLFNPEYSNGVDDEFYYYFKTYSTMSQDKISTELERLSSALSSQEDRDDWPENLINVLPKDMASAFKYYNRHPIFSSLMDIIQAKPIKPSDVGRFPEFFIYRYLAPYLRHIEGQPNLLKLFSSEINILRKSSDLCNALPSDIAKNVNFNLPKMNKLVMSDWRERILSQVKKTMATHLKKENQIESRLKTTIYWYFRETLRFGSHSRISMRYDRIELEYIAEAIAVCLVLGKQTGASHQAVIPLIKILENVVKIHELYCSRYNPLEDSSDLFVQYDSDLAKIYTAVTL
jgi:hypothetical protein